MAAQPTLGTLLAKNLAERPDALAFVDGERRLSYAEFDRLCAGTAAWLQGQGIGPGDRVAVWLVNRIEWLALLFALARLGATMMSVNTRFRTAELEHVLARSAARLLVIQRHFRSIDFDAVLAEVDGSGLSALQRIAVLDGGANLPPTMLGKPTVAFAPDAAGTAPAPADRSAPDALMILFTTSGTTQGPKLVMHVQGAIALHAQHVAKAFGFDAPGSATLGAVPICGTFGLVAALASLSAGAPLVMMEAFDAQRAAALVRSHRLTHVFGTDEMLRRLLDLDATAGALPSVRMLGFVLNEELAARAYARGWPVAGLYGSSEVQALFSLQSMELPMQERILGGGRPASPEVEVRVRDVDSGQLLPPGASGELEIRSPTSFIGYLDNPEATAKVMRSDGFFRTGDVGRVREDGSFVFLTRTGDAIRLGGFLVSPVEIEEVIRQLPGVADAQVVAVEIARQTRGVAFVIRSEGQQTAVSEADVVAWVKSRMAGYKVPAQVWFVDTYPVTHSANGDKIQRARLREIALARLAEPR
ncbi:MAG: AMP-binding protein [Burkholderiaceae bacterium]|nr:AMP-binding protein [Burkholderiaceae bacterium]